MWEALAYAFFTFLVILGFFELIRATESLHGCGNCGERAFLVLPMRGEAETAEALLREGVLALDELPVQDGQLILLDCGMSAELRQLCELFCRDYSCARLFASDEFYGIIDGEYS